MTYFFISWGETFLLRDFLMSFKKGKEKEKRIRKYIRRTREKRKENVKICVRDENEVCQ